MLRRDLHSPSARTGSRSPGRRSPGRPGFPEYPGEQPIGQQPGILRIETEDDLVEIPGQFLRVFVVCLHVLDDFGEQVSARLGCFSNSAVGPELLRLVEGPAQHLQMLGLVEVLHRDFVECGLHAREVGANTDGTERGDDQQRRCLQVDLVAEQLVHCLVQQLVAAFEFPPEVSFQVCVRRPAWDRHLEGEGAAVSAGHRSGMADEGTDVEEHFLRCLFLAEVDVAPLAHEFRRLHVPHS